MTEKKILELTDDELEVLEFAVICRISSYRGKEAADKETLIRLQNKIISLANEEKNEDSSCNFGDKKT